MIDKAGNPDFPVGLKITTEEDLKDFIQAVANKAYTLGIPRELWFLRIESLEMNRVIFRFQDNPDSPLSFVHTVYKEVPIYIQVEEALRRAQQVINVQNKAQDALVLKIANSLVQLAQGPR